MEWLMNREMMQEIDRITMQEIGIPNMVLMERAALKVTGHVEALIQKEGYHLESKVLVVCGIGNNGGDGVATARLLQLKGIHAEIYVLGNYEKMTEQMRQQVEIAKHLGVPFVQEPSYTDYSIIVDAIFGVGLGRPIHGIYEFVIQQMNESQAKIVSVDLPSGVNADDGSILNLAVQADITVTFGYSKIGLVRYPGSMMAGKVYVEDVGFPSMAYEKAMQQHSDWNEYITYTKEDIKRLPIRPKHSHKGTFGTVLVIAGSKGMSGACYFSAKAALRSGAGLVKVLTVEENREILQTLLPEAIVLTYSDILLEENLSYYVNIIESASAIVVGPGLGTAPISMKILEIVLKYTKVWTVVDADGINLLSELVTRMMKDVDEKDETDRSLIQKRLECLARILPEKIILTPHLKEFSRLIHCEVTKINKMFIDTIDICSYNKVLIYVIKDSVTTVVCGKLRYFNQTGNDGLATGGTGDVLTGIIGGLLAQGLLPFEAACLGVLAHGLTSESYSKVHYSGSMIASDVIEYIGDVFQTDIQ